MSRAAQIKDILAWVHRLTSPLRPPLGEAPAEVFIFCYHRINTRERNPLGVDLQVFKEQLELFASTGTLLDPETFFRFAQGEISLTSARNFLLTFDDGYVSTVEAAFPVLQNAGARAISFIATDHLGRQSPYSPDRRNPSRERLLNIDEVRHSQSVYLYQSHGHRHIDYFHSSKESVLADLAASLGWFEQALGYRPCSIAYPFGLAPRWPHWQDDFRREGITMGFVTGSHPLKAPTSTSAQIPLLALPRVGYLTDETLVHTRARLSGGLTILRVLDAPWVRRIKSGRSS